ncbi:MAG: PD-(D/E)XK nuclease family protein [Candidatus Aenigmatarchaeota archaeon]
MAQQTLESNETQEKEQDFGHKQLDKCPYCEGGLVKRGVRKKKHESVQIYFCKNCEKKITPLLTKNKTYPLRIIIDSMTLYNKLNPLESIPQMIKDTYGIVITPRIISDWLKEYATLLPFLRMREFAAKKYQRDAIQETKMFHQQIYEFKYHRAKMNMILEEEFKHQKFSPLKEFLELVSAECPHQIFQNSMRASDYKNTFNLDGVRFVPKINAAVRTAGFVVQSVSNNKMRHKLLQDFMIANDSVTVAAEVPVLLDADDVRHLKHELNFSVPFQVNEGEHVTGHIDLIQVRNGSLYIMDYKPSAAKERPVDQLMIYALALSRLTGLRLYNMKCAWFDDKNYYEFFPLHAVYKKKQKRMPRDQQRLSEVMEPRIA